MKADKLKIYCVRTDYLGITDIKDFAVNVVLKSDVDEAIAELKEDNKLLKERIANGDVSRITWIDSALELSRENESLKQKLHDAEMRADLAEAAETERKIDYDKLKAENERLKGDLDIAKMHVDALMKNSSNDNTKPDMSNEDCRIRSVGGENLIARVKEVCNKYAVSTIQDLDYEFERHLRRMERDRREFAKILKETKRALWLARAERAKARKNYWYARSCHEGDKDFWSIDGSAVKYIGCIKRTNFDWLKVWSEVEIKCRAKADTFKEAK